LFETGAVATLVGWLWYLAATSPAQPSSQQSVTDRKLDAVQQVAFAHQQATSTTLDSMQQVAALRQTTNNIGLDAVQQVAAAHHDATSIKLQALQQAAAAHQTATDIKLDALDAKLDAMQAAAAANHAAVLAALADMSAAQSRQLQLASTRSNVVVVAAAAANDRERRPVRTLVAASRADVAEWLTHAGYAQYVGALTSMDGAALLRVTALRLLADAGVVAPRDVAPLLACIAAAAASQPPTDEPDASAA
jgi:hypothetical protein